MRLLSCGEAPGRVSAQALEECLYAVNGFVRTDAGRDALVVWLKYTRDLTEALVGLATTLGDEALFGVSEQVEQFSGTPNVR
jgi:hypothetical protein